MGVESVLRRGRKVRQKLMRSRCRITRPGTGSREFDPETGSYSDTSDDVVYEGICHFKSRSSVGERDPNTAEREMVLMQYEVILPHGSDSSPIDIGDSVEITECRDDPHALGRVFPVFNVELATDRTARHVTVVDQSRGESLYG